MCSLNYPPLELIRILGLAAIKRQSAAGFVDLGTKRFYESNTHQLAKYVPKDIGPIGKL